MKLKSHLIKNNKRDILEGVLQFSKKKAKKVKFLDARKYWEKHFGREIKITMLA